MVHLNYEVLERLPLLIGHLASWSTDCDNIKQDCLLTINGVQSVYEAIEDVSLALSWASSLV